jgi:hypothetical protein
VTESHGFAGEQSFSAPVFHDSGKGGKSGSPRIFLGDGEEWGGVIVYAASVDGQYTHSPHCHGSEHGHFFICSPCQTKCEWTRSHTGRKALTRGLNAGHWENASLEGVESPVLPRLHSLADSVDWSWGGYDAFHAPRPGRANYSRMPSGGGKSRKIPFSFHAVSRCPIPAEELSSNTQERLLILFPVLKDGRQMRGQTEHCERLDGEEERLPEPADPTIPSLVIILIPSCEPFLASGTTERMPASREGGPQ